MLWSELPFAIETSTIVANVSTKEPTTIPESLDVIEIVLLLQKRIRLNAPIEAINRTQ